MTDFALFESWGEQKSKTMKLNFKAFILMTVVLFVACNGNQSKPNERKANSKAISINQPSRDITTIQEEVRQGNIDSYLELRDIYMDFSFEEFLFWALLMANMYDYPPAHYDVFYTITISYVGDETKFNEIDESTQALAMAHLLIAANQGYGEAKETLKQMQNP